MGSATTQILFLLALLVPGLIYVASLYSTINTIHPENRAIKPWMIWLLLIPLFNVYYHLFIVSKLSKSISNEVRGNDEILKANKQTYAIGVVCSVAMIVWAMIKLLLLSSFSTFNVIASVCSWIGMISWIIYWVGIAQHKSRIKRLQKTQAIPE